MALNGSGPISLAGSTAGQSIAVELGLSPTGTIGLNTASVRTLAGVPSGAIVMPTNFYGKSNRVVSSATISANTANYTVNTAKAPSYSSGKTDFTLTINSGIVVFSGSTGSYAMTVDTSWAAGDTVTIVNNGTILGKGGTGAAGGTGNPNPAGLVGGPALIVNRAITMNNTSGRIAGGGGGGGGGREGIQPKAGSYTQGGAGGGGIGNGGVNLANPNPGFAGPSISPVATAGTLTAAGSGGAGFTGLSPAGAGGPGGSYGSSGTPGSIPSISTSAGGAAGACIAGNANITYTPGGTGTRNGSIS